MPLILTMQIQGFMAAAIAADTKVIMAVRLIIIPLIIIPADMAAIIGIMAIMEIEAGIIAGDSRINLTESALTEAIDRSIRAIADIIGIEYLSDPASLWPDTH
ncbi:hypothetical protein [Candidatus Methylobacter favarea]|uniref:hypothetical protein n=1 Tax=Candidatus Methylobacter favarea TaxID=2707345 RepID=UPI00157C5B54|nr:hypothetical protein [Candidatus Methylobacter favarea]